MANPTTNFGWQMPTSTDLVTDLPADFEVFGQAVDTALVDLKGGTTGQVLSKASNTNMDFTWVTTDDANAIQNSIVDAKGDIVAASANDTPARLAVGTNGQVLTADSTAATGLKWATAATGGMTLINTTTIGSGVSSTSLPASTFTSTYTNYKFLFTGVTSTSANITVSLRLRSGSTDESAAQYSSQGYRSTGSLAQYAYLNQTSGEIGFIRTGFAERFFVSGEIYRPQEAIQTLYQSNYAIDNAGTFTNLQASGLLNTSTSYDSMSFIYAGGTVTGGKVSVYGYNI
jgi:hypothetical protein